MQILTSFPESWKVTIEVLTGGGRDKYGNVLPTSSRDVPGCLLSPRTSTEPDNRSAYVDGEAILLAPKGTVIKSTDKVRSPEGSTIQGTWAVDGDPINWPDGVEVPLRKDGT